MTSELGQAALWCPKELGFVILVPITAIIGKLFAVILVLIATIIADSIAINWLGSDLPLWKHLDEITVRVFDERQAFHSARIWGLCEFDSERLESLARSVNIWYCHADVPEATAHLGAIFSAGRLGVACVVQPIICFLLRSVVPSDLETGRRSHAKFELLIGIRWDITRVAVSHEIDRESPLREIPVANQLESEDVCVEL